MDSVGQDTELKHLVWSMVKGLRRPQWVILGRLGATSAWGKGWRSHELKVGSKQE